MASAMDALVPESALHEHPFCNEALDTEAAPARAELDRISPALTRFGSYAIDDVLEMVIAHIENRLKSSEEVKSPSGVPAGIHSQHSRQIEVCLARFKAAKIPAVSLREYLMRIHQHCPFTSMKLLAVVHYLNTLDVMYREIAKVLQPATAHRLVLAAVVIASKVLEDVRLSSQLRFSLVGGINLHSLRGLELAFFFLMNGRVWINDQCLVSAARFLLGEVNPASGLHPLTDTDESGVIWSEVGNRRVAPVVACVNSESAQ